MSDSGTARRLGRPPATTGEETRARLVRAARQCFAEFGYAGTSNRHIAEASGLTTGAIYHYFSSKQELYAAANEGVQQVIYARFDEVVRDKASLLEELSAVLDAAVELNRQDPSLAAFFVARRTDAHRYPELAHLDADETDRVRFFGDMVRRAVARGELPPDHAPMLMNIIRVVTAGLVFAASTDLALQSATVEAVKHLMAGTLFAAPALHPV